MELIESMEIKNKDKDKDKDKDKCHDKCNGITRSIASEECAIACILKGECDKLKKVLECDPSFEEILLVNDSVAQTIVDVTHLEIVLYNKLKLAGDDEKHEKHCNKTKIFGVVFDECYRPCPCAIVKVNNCEVKADNNGFYCTETNDKRIELKATCGCKQSALCVIENAKCCEYKINLLVK